MENTNKLIRQYIPKGTNISMITDNYIRKVQKKINRRPREKLIFSTPIKNFKTFYYYCAIKGNRPMVIGNKVKKNYANMSEM